MYGSLYSVSTYYIQVSFFNVNNIFYLPSILIQYVTI